MMDDWGDSLIGLLVIVACFVIGILLASCIHNDKSKQSLLVINNLDDGQALHSIILGPVNFEGTSQSFSDLIIRYYYNRDDDLKDSIQDSINDFIEKGGGNPKNCWHMEFYAYPSKDKFLNLWDHCPDQKMNRLVKTFKKYGGDAAIYASCFTQQSGVLGVNPANAKHQYDVDKEIIENGISREALLEDVKAQLDVECKTYGNKYAIENAIETAFIPIPFGTKDNSIAIKFRSDAKANVRWDVLSYVQGGAPIVQTENRVVQ